MGRAGSGSGGEAAPQAALAHAALVGPAGGSDGETQEAWLGRMVEGCLQLPHVQPAYLFVCRHQCHVEAVMHVDGANGAAPSVAPGQVRPLAWEDAPGSVNRTVGSDSLKGSAD